MRVISVLTPAPDSEMNLAANFEMRRCFGTRSMGCQLSSSLVNITQTAICEEVRASQVSTSPGSDGHDDSTAETQPPGPASPRRSKF